MSDFATINVRNTTKSELLAESKDKSSELGTELSMAQFIEFLLNFYKARK